MIGAKRFEAWTYILSLDRLEIDISLINVLPKKRKKKKERRIDKPIEKLVLFHRYSQPIK